MNKEHLQHFAEQSAFIPDIYNYCDRWCKRCPFTSRCMNFVLAQEQLGDIDSFDIRSPAFWQSLMDAFRVTREFLEDVLKRCGLEITEDDLNRARAAEQRKQQRLEEHACSRTAKRYIAIVDEWFEAMQPFFQECETEWREAEEADCSDTDACKQFEEMQRLIETIRWYQRQIYAKIMRALSGKYDELLSSILKGTPKDCDGSAKVALIGIDRSISAWIALRECLPTRNDDIIDLLVALDRMRRDVEITFPDARAFIRPGFDEIADE